MTVCCDSVTVFSDMLLEEIGHADRLQLSQVPGSSLLLTLALLCDNRGPSAVYQQKFRTALALKYLCGLNAFNLRRIEKSVITFAINPALW